MGDKLSNDTGDWADAKVEDEPEVELPIPNELGEYFTRVYNDPEVTGFERMQAALGLSNFWLGLEVNRLNDFVGGLQFMSGPPMTDQKLN